MKCTYCGNSEGYIQVPDPNGGDKPWVVCSVCETVLGYQISEGMAIMAINSIKNDKHLSINAKRRLINNLKKVLEKKKGDTEDKLSDLQAYV